MFKVFLRAGCVLVGVAFLATKLSASGVLYQFNTPFAGDPSPSGPTPWMTADFEDVSGGVDLTISGAGLVGSEFASEMYFNLSTNLNATSLVFSQTVSSGTFSTPTINTSASQTFKADGDGKYNINFEFGTASGTTFGSGDSISYFISSLSIPGLVATNFATLGLKASGIGPFFAAVHIQSLGDGSSTWVEPGSGPIIVPVPEPTPIALLAISTILWGAWRLRMRKV